MKIEGWRGKGKSAATPQWKLEARKIKNIASRPGYSMGGLPRSRNKPAVVSLPTLKCLSTVDGEQG